MNEYTIPLEGQPYYRSSGIIYAVDGNGFRYAVGRVDFERYDEQNFQYVFTPSWYVIDALPPAIFQGIPGLDLSSRLERYYRVNMTPYFIAERTPGKGREDLWELLEDVGLDYYDRFEWLLRTDMRCGTDNLIVERLTPPRRFTFDLETELLDNLQPDDCVVIRAFQDIAATSHQLRRRLLHILRSGAKIFDEEEGRELSASERSTLLKVLLLQEFMDEQNHRIRHQEGVSKAKTEGKYKGRKRIDIDEILLTQIADEFAQRKITEEEAMRRLGIASRATFYRRLKELRNK